MTKKISKGMSLQKLDELLKSNSFDLYQWKITAKEAFKTSPYGSKLNKKAFLNQYQNWDNQEKVQIEILLQLIKKDVIVEIVSEGGKDRGGYYVVYSVSSDNETFIFKIYGITDFTDLLDVYYIGKMLIKPYFTLEELYHEALKPNN